MSHSSVRMQVAFHFVLYKQPFSGASFPRELPAFFPAPVKTCTPAFLTYSE